MYGCYRIDDSEQQWFLQLNRKAMQVLLIILPLAPSKTIWHKVDTEQVFVKQMNGLVNEKKKESRNKHLFTHLLKNHCKYLDNLPNQLKTFEVQLN